MSGFPKLRTLAHDDRHNVAVDDVPHKYTNNEANKATTLMQKWVWQNSAKAEQFIRVEEMHQRQALTENYNTSFSFPGTLYKMPTSKRRVKIA